MFRTLIYPSSGACDYSVELPHWSYCSWFDVCWSFGVFGLECNTDTTPTQPHRNSNTHRTKINTTNVVIQQSSRKLLMMDILMSETCWAHKKWNKIASDIKLVFYSSIIWQLCIFPAFSSFCFASHFFFMPLSCRHLFLFIIFSSLIWFFFRPCCLPSFTDDPPYHPHLYPYIFHSCTTKTIKLKQEVVYM